MQVRKRRNIAQIARSQTQMPAQLLSTSRPCIILSAKDAKERLNVLWEILVGMSISKHQVSIKSNVPQELLRCSSKSAAFNLKKQLKTEKLVGFSMLA